MILGLVIGLVSGIVQFVLLAKFTGAVTGGAFSKKSVLFALSQFLLPMVVLLCCAAFLKKSLIWAAVGITVALVALSLVRFRLAKKNK